MFETKPINGSNRDSIHPPLPPHSLQKCLKVAGMSAAVTKRLMEAHQLVTIEDICFCSSKVQDLMKIYNGQQTRQTNKFGMAAQ